MFIIIYMLFLDPSPAPPLFTNGVLGRKRSGHGWSEGELVSFVSSCMTIATRLILCRRSRPSRPHDDDVESGPTSSLSRRRHHHRDELEVSPRSAHHGRFPSRRSSHSGQESSPFDHNCSGEFGTGTTSSDPRNATSQGQ
ncbi:uncharacterized protein LOC120252866 [Dioscorea cayenensis subsp. rotundata]|uniref:Uncharacterized protein LOC120252866 n=1 Tax=Dioscorea cayennensis subsp. rotundata TaxID=55577 RepID=A0AB40APL9_DIOCR|nr:uncharacterized protein LOC120252866 [Dioscorea cayenensis subsp. rotundata]